MPLPSGGVRSSPIRGRHNNLETLAHHRGRAKQEFVANSIHMDCRFWARLEIVNQNRQSLTSDGVVYGVWGMARVWPVVYPRHKLGLRFLKVCLRNREFTCGMAIFLLK